MHNKLTLCFRWGVKSLFNMHRWAAELIWLLNSNQQTEVNRKEKKDAANWFAEGERKQ